MKFLPLITVAICLFFIPISTPEKLIFASTHFRHGARAPNSIDSDSLDRVGEHWPAPGQLTPVGMRMQYLLGLRNHKRYIEDYKLLSPTYDPHEILVYSTNYNRTLMSVFSQIQGLYPHKPEFGRSLNEEQEIAAIPQVRVNESYIKEEVDIMNNSALPDFMTVLPIRMISDVDKKANIYSDDTCVLAAYEETKNSDQDSIIAVRYVFNEKYKKYLNEFFGENSTYEFTWMTKFCDAFIASYTDQRNITDLKNTGIDFEELIESCYEVQKIKFRDYVLNGGKNKFDRLESSKLLREMMRLMKQRADDDINQVTEVNSADFSRPKMLMFSAHDTTVSCHEMAMINCFNLDFDSFQLPKFTAQMTFEVTRKDDSEISDISKLTYDDYTVNYYFNDEKLLSTSLSNFMEKLGNYLWTDEEVDNFCSGKNSSETDNSDDGNSKNDNLVLYIVAISVLGAVVLALIVSFIILLIMYRGIKTGGSGKSISLIGMSKSNN